MERNITIEDWEEIPDIPDVTDELKFSEEFEQLLKEEFDILKHQYPKEERDLILSILATILHKYLLPNSDNYNRDIFTNKYAIFDKLDELYYVGLMKFETSFNHSYHSYIRLKPEDFSIQGRDRMDASNFFPPSCNCGAPILMRYTDSDVTDLICVKCKKKGCAL